MASITREQAIQTLEDGQRRLDALFGQLAEEQLVRPATIGGGDWSAKDLLGHIARWNEIAIEARDAWRRGERGSRHRRWIAGWPPGFPPDRGCGQ
jgi:hypothetical protein